MWGRLPNLPLLGLTQRKRDQWTCENAITQNKVNIVNKAGHVCDIKSLSDTEGARKFYFH